METTWRRTAGSAVAVAVLLLTAFAPSVSSTTPPGPGGYDLLGTFENSQNATDLLFDRPGYNNQSAVSLPNHAFVNSATVNISFGVFPGSRSAPWDPALDVGDDGTVDWRFDSSRGGAVGLQDRFSNGDTQEKLRFEDNGTQQFSVKLPKGGTVTDAYVDVEGYPMPYWVKQYTLTPKTDSPGEYGPKMMEYKGDLWVIWQTYDKNLTDGKEFSDVVVRNFDGTHWAPHILDLSAPKDDFEDDIPQLISYSGKLYAVWAKGDGKSTPGGNSELVYRAYDGTSWSPEARISGPKEDGLNTYERCVVFNDSVSKTEKLYIFWKTTDPNVANVAMNGQDEDIVYRAFDGTGWGPITEITAASNDATDWSVDAIVYKRMLYVIWDTWDTHRGGWGSRGDADVVYRAFDGRSWTSLKDLSPLSDSALMEGALDDALPRLYVYDNPVTGESELFAIWMRGNSILNPGGVGFDIVYRRYTGGDWLPMEKISPAASATKVDNMFPALIEFNSTLYAIWTIGTNTTSHQEGSTNLIATYGDIIIRSFDGASWSPVLELTPMGNGYDNASHPSIYVFDGKVYAAWETPLPTQHGTTSWEIVMRHLELDPVGVRISLGDGGQVTWGWEKLPNSKMRVHFDPAEMTRLLHSAPTLHEDGYGNQYTEIPLTLSVDTPSNVLLSNLTIEYDYKVTVDFTKTAQERTAAARDNTRVDTPVRINFKVSTGQAGRISLDHPVIKYYLDYPPWLDRPVPTVEVLEDEPRDYVLNLNDYFNDDWDAGNLSFIVLEVRDPDGGVAPSIADGYLNVGLPIPNWNGNVTVVVRAFDRTGFYHNDSNAFVIRVLPVNDAPILDYVPDRNDLQLDDEHTEYLTAHDPDGDTLRFSTDSPWVKVDTRTGKLTVDFQLAYPRPLVFNVSVADPSGASDSQQVTYNYTVHKMRVETKHAFPYGLFLLLLVVLCLVAAERLRRPYRRSEEDQIWEEEAEEEERLRAEERGSWFRRWF